jgi:hypothetical protein
MTYLLEHPTYQKIESDDHAMRGFEDKAQLSIFSLVMCSGKHAIDL